MKRRDRDHAHERSYLAVFAALAAITLIEYIYAAAMSSRFVPLVVGLTGMAILKATLVAMFFMHLRFEGRWTRIILVPTVFLATALVLAMVPDLGFPAR
jgi:cytochrome c oxidase subunit 4